MNGLWTSSLLETRKVHSLKVKYCAKEKAQQLEYLTYKVMTWVKIPRKLDADNCICKPIDPSEEWRVQARESPESLGISRQQWTRDPASSKVEGKDWHSSCPLITTYTIVHVWAWASTKIKKKELSTEYCILIFHFPQMWEHIHGALTDENGLEMTKSLCCQLLHLYFFLPSKLSFGGKLCLLWQVPEIGFSWNWELERTLH